MKKEESKEGKKIDTRKLHQQLLLVTIMKQRFAVSDKLPSKTLIG
jgi:hypothetical protein